MNRKEFPIKTAAGHFFDGSKPREEFYDLENDPHETHNLVDDPEYAEELNRLCARLDRWEQKLPDTPVKEFDLVTPGAPELLD